MIRETNPAIAVNHIDRTWMYRERNGAVELTTDELCLHINKITGAIKYTTCGQKLLLSERSKECRQIETDLNNRHKTWLFLDFQKKENLYGIGSPTQNGIKLRSSAHYISPGAGTGELPFLLSDQGYGILLASSGPAICCDIPVYGSYLYTEEEAIDYYFIAGKRQNTILNAYAYLLGRL